MNGGIDIHLPAPHPGQKRLLAEARRFNIVVCGRRWGKTLFGVDRAVWGAISGGPIGWFAPTYKILADAWRECMRVLYPLTAKLSQQEHRIDLVTGGSVECWSLDNRDAGRGRKYAGIVVDEAAMVPDLKDVWEATLTPTLADMKGWGWLLSTPRGYDDFHGFYERGQDPDFAEWQSWRMPTATNPYIAASELVTLRQGMDPRFFAQEFEASFEELAGRVYFRFDRDLNVRSDIADTGGDLLIGMDFNVAPMSACIAVRAGDQLHVFDEFELVNSNTEEMCRALLARYPKRAIRVYPDPSGSARKTSAPVGQTDFAILRSAGFRIVAPNAAPPVVDRINEVNAVACNADNRRRLYVHPRCKSLIRSLSQLTYKDGASVVDKTSGLDHMADALGYLVHAEFPLARPQGGGPAVRPMGL